MLVIEMAVWSVTPRERSRYTRNMMLQNVASHAHLPDNLRTFAITRPSITRVEMISCQLITPRRDRHLRGLDLVPPYKHGFIQLKG